MWTKIKNKSIGGEISWQLDRHNRKAKVAKTGRNFDSKRKVKGKRFGQSVAHYTSETEVWALRGCESTNKTVGRDYLHTLLNENKFQEENHHFIFSVSYGEIP